MLKDNIRPESHQRFLGPKITKKNVRCDLEFKLHLLGFGPGLKNLYIGGLLTIIFEYLSQLVIDFEVACGDDLEDGVTIVFEIENVIDSLVFSLGVGKTLGGEVAQSKAVSLKSLDKDALPILERGLALVLRHYY